VTRTNILAMLTHADSAQCRPRLVEQRRNPAGGARPPREATPCVPDIRVDRVWACRISHDASGLRTSPARL